MNVAIYTYFRPLFGRLCRSWQRHLLDRGHSVQVVEATCLGDHAIPWQEQRDVHLVIAGVWILKALRDFGFPTAGKTALWICEPLFDQPEITHAWKASILKDVAARFDAVAGMNDQIVQYLRNQFPAVPTFKIPYTIDAADILVPLPENQRTIISTYPITSSMADLPGRRFS